MKPLFIHKESNPRTRLMLGIAQAMESAGLPLAVADYSTPIFDTLEALQPDVVYVGEGALTKAVALWSQEHPGVPIHYFRSKKPSPVEKEIGQLNLYLPEHLMPALNLFHKPNLIDREAFVVYHGPQDYEILKQLRSFNRPFRIFGPTPWRVPEYLGNLSPHEAYSMAIDAFSPTLTDDVFFDMIQAGANPQSPNTAYISNSIFDFLEDRIPWNTFVRENNYHARAMTILAGCTEEQAALQDVMEKHLW